MPDFYSDYFFLQTTELTLNGSLLTNFIFIKFFDFSFDLHSGGFRTLTTGLIRVKLVIEILFHCRKSDRKWQRMSSLCEIEDSFLRARQLMSLQKYIITEFVLCRLNHEPISRSFSLLSSL